MRRIPYSIQERNVVPLILVVDSPKGKGRIIFLQGEDFTFSPYGIFVRRYRSLEISRVNHKKVNSNFKEIGIWNTWEFYFSLRARYAVLDGVEGILRVLVMMGFSEEEAATVTGEAKKRFSTPFPFAQEEHFCPYFFRDYAEGYL